MSHSLTLTGDVKLEAAAGNTKPALIVIRAYTGGVVRTADLPLPSVVDISGMVLPESVPLLMDHQNLIGSIAGSGVPMIREGELFIGGELARTTQSAQQIIALSQSGVRLGASVGVEGTDVVKISAGDTVEANGRTFKERTPILFFRKSLLREVSFTPVGADALAGVVSISASANRNRGSNMVTANEAAKIHARIESVELKCSSAFDGRLRDTKERALSGSLDPLSFEHEISAIESADSELHTIRASRVPAGKFSSISGVGGGGDVKIMSAALCMAGGLNCEKLFDERTLEVAYPVSRQTSLQSLLVQAAIDGGYQPAHVAERVGNNNLRQILQAAFMPSLRATGWSTTSIGDILSNVGNKSLLNGFVEIDDAWRSIARVETVDNFKEHTFVRLLDNLEFEPLAPNGDIAHGQLSDEKLTGKAGTLAKMITLSREDIINDDLGALLNVGRLLGRAAAQALNRLFWTKFLANDGFWASGNNNQIDGTLDNAGTGLTTALAFFRQQRSPAADGSKLVGGAPSVLLSGANTEIPGRRLLNSSSVVGGTTTTGGSNPFVGLAQLIIADRITDESCGGDPDSQEWYLLRPAAYLSSMIVCALNGTVAPIIESSQVDFSNLGIALRGYCDVGVSRGEKLAGLKITGEPSS